MHSAERKTPRSGFTLLEVVLALALSVVVFSLLSMAIEMYLMRVDQSRGRVEANQLARTVVDRIATDLRAARYSAPVQSSSPSSSGSGSSPSSGSSSSSSSGGSSSTSGGSSSSSSGTGSSSSGSSSSSSNTSTEAGVIRGIFGTSDRLRIDRAEPLDLTRRFVNQEELLLPRPVDLPQSVIYFLREGRRMTAADFAARGVDDEPLADVAGLCVYQMPTEALIATGDEEGETATEQDALLLAPEVVELTFSYFDGEELLETWDSAEMESLPKAVQIELTVLVEGDPDEDEEAVVTSGEPVVNSQSDLITHRVLIELPPIQTPRQANGPTKRAEQNQSNSNSGGGGGAGASR